MSCVEMPLHVDRVLCQPGVHGACQRVLSTTCVCSGQQQELVPEAAHNLTRSGPGSVAIACVLMSLPVMRQSGHNMYLIGRRYKTTVSWPWLALYEGC